MWAIPLRLWKECTFKHDPCQVFFLGDEAHARNKQLITSFDIFSLLVLRWISAPMESNLTKYIYQFSSWDTQLIKWHMISQSVILTYLVHWYFYWDNMSLIDISKCSMVVSKINNGLTWMISWNLYIWERAGVFSECGRSNSTCSQLQRRSRSISPQNIRDLKQNVLPFLMSKLGDSSWNVWWVIAQTSGQAKLIHTQTDAVDDNTWIKANTGLGWKAVNHSDKIGLF